MISQMIIFQNQNPQIQQLQTLSHMHPNSFFTPRTDNPNEVQQARASSMFSKQLQYGQIPTTAFQKNRPASVSKILPGSTENDLMKWIPLIKLTRKIQSKVRTEYMFFWCRLENLKRSKPTINDANKQNQFEKLNLPVQNTQKQKPKQSCQIVKPAITNVMPHSQSTNPSKNQVQQIKNTFNQNSIHNRIENQKKNIEQNLADKQNKPSKLIISLSTAFESIKKQKLREGHERLCSYSSKKFSLEVLKNLNFKSSQTILLFTAVRMIKKYSHMIMKGEILANTLKNLMKKAKTQNLRYLIEIAVNKKQINEKKQSKQNQQNPKNEGIPKSLIKQIPIAFLSTDEPTPKPIKFSSHLSSKQVRPKNSQNLQKVKPIEFLIRPNPCKPIAIKFKFFPSYERGVIGFKEDKTVDKIFKNQNQHEKLKKLSRLHPEEPFFEIPDISQITLFNPIINSNSSFSQHTFAKSVLKNCNNSIETNFKSQEETNVTKEPNHFAQMSPRLGERSLEKAQDHESLSVKSRSFGRIIYLKPFASTNVKKNPQTPSSTKKIIGIFSKKNSVELINKDSGEFFKKHSVELFKKDALPKNFQSKLSTCKSSIVKKLDHFTETKPQKNHESNNKKNVETGSIQKYKVTSTVSYRKAEKENIKPQESCKRITKTQENIKKSVKTSKVVEKLLDLSAKRFGTTKKQDRKIPQKQNKSVCSYDKTSSRKALHKNSSTKENYLSEFNSLSGKVISYQEFIKQCPTSSGRKPLMEISENEPIFKHIQITEQDHSTKDLDVFYQSCSAQLPKERVELGEPKCKRLRSKIEKMELNTARKMKLEIENMINQRKKSSIGILKY